MSQWRSINEGRIDKVIKNKKMKFSLYFLRFLVYDWKKKDNLGFGNGV